MLDANVDSLMYVLCGIDLALCCIIIIGGKYWVWLCCFYCSAQNCETPDYGMNTIIPVVTVPQIQIHVNSQSQREQRGELSPLVELTHIHVQCTLLHCTFLQCTSLHCTVYSATVWQSSHQQIPSQTEIWWKSTNQLSPVNYTYTQIHH